MFLSAEQLHDLTDRQQPAAQIRWLVAKGWAFELSAAGRPKVAMREFERHMLSGTKTRATREPNLAALDRLG